MDAACVRKNWTPVSLMRPILSPRRCRSSTDGARKARMKRMGTPDRIETQGFDVIEQVFDANEIDALSGVLSGAALARSRAGARHLMSDPAVAEFARAERLLCWVRSVL